MGVYRTRENGHKHHTVVTNGCRPGDGQVRILVADDHMLVDSEDHTGAGVAYRRMREAVSVGAEVVNPQIPRHYAASVRRHRLGKLACEDSLAVAPRWRTLCVSGALSARK